MQPGADWRGMAALLRAGVTVSYAGHVGALLAGFGVLTHGLRTGFAVALGLWAYLLYLQLRVRFDAELFAWLADGGTTAELDGFLARSGLRKTAGNRTGEERMAGAMGLWRKLLVVLGLELAACAVGVRW